MLFYSVCGLGLYGFIFPPIHKAIPVPARRPSRAHQGSLLSKAASPAATPPAPNNPHLASRLFSWGVSGGVLVECTDLGTGTAARTEDSVWFCFGGNTSTSWGTITFSCVFLLPFSCFRVSFEWQFAHSVIVWLGWCSLSGWCSSSFWGSLSPHFWQNLERSFPLVNLEIVDGDAPRLFLISS